jgi:hypothetical protein
MSSQGKKHEKNGEPILKQGILRKQGGQYKSWKDRWFTLTKDCLSYYKSLETEEPIKRIALKDIKSCKQDNSNDVRFPSRYPYYFCVETDARTYAISARNESERNEWVDAINKLKTETAHPQVAPQKEVETISTSDKPSDIVPKPFTKKEREPFEGKPLEHEFAFEEFQAHLRGLVRSEQLSDAKFNVQGQIFHAHKAIISTRCPVLAKSFPTSSKGSPPAITIDELRPETFSSVLDFIYTGVTELTPSNVVYIHFAAVAYELTRLKELTEVFIRDNTNVNNVLVMLVAANKLKEEEIERFLLGYMQDVNRYTSIIKQPQASEIAQTNKDLYVTMSQVLALPHEAFANNLDKIVVSPNELSKDISKLLITLDHADMRVITKDGEVFAHRVIIAARCNIFIEEGSLGVDEEHVSSISKFQILKFPTLDSQVVQIMLESFYSNLVKLGYLEDAYGLIELADRVQQENIVLVCNEMMKQNLKKETALKILMVASEYELSALKKETLQLIVQEAPQILKRKELRTILSQWPWNLIDIVRALIRGKDGEFTDDEEQDNQPESEDDFEEEEPFSTEMS